jgi:flagellum-specific ATP synthase
VNHEALLETARTAESIRLRGKVNQMVGLVIESNGPPVSVGELCEIRGGSGAGRPAEASSDEGPVVDAEVVGFRDSKVLLMPLGPVDGVGPGSTVTAAQEPFSVRVGDELLGRVLNGLGRPIDDKGPIWSKDKQPVNASPPDPLRRQRIREPLGTGIRSIDSLITCGKGQRVGIFAGSGVGKSVLMGMIARSSEAHINVIALIGERGREVRDFLERDLGEEGLRRSVVVVVTSDQPALVRIKGALVATAVAEHFRDRGADVMLMMDSVTRVAMAQREVGLAIGEPPTTRGYTPSVFAFLPRLLERAGMAERGSITGLYTVLVEGDDTNEPVSDTTRSILDGHIVLSRRLASQGHYPAVDVLESVSRVMVDVVDEEHMAVANRIRDTLGTYREAQDLINIGAYRRGNNPRIDFAIERIDRINAFLRQGIQEHSDLPGSREAMMRLLE